MLTRTSQKSLEKRRLIAQVAIKLFLRQGVQGTSTRDIAKALGISTGSLYHYFRSKDEIIDLVAQLATQTADTFREYYVGLGNVSLTEVVRKCIIELILGGEQRRDRNLFLIREFRVLSPSRGAALIESARQYILFFEQLLDEGVRSGDFEIKNTRLVAFNIWATAQEWVLRRWFWRGDLTAEEFAEQQADLILASISAHDKAAVGNTIRTAQ